MNTKTITRPTVLFYLACLVVFVVGVASLVDSAKGIVALDGYKHGVALCQGGEDIQAEIIFSGWDNKTPVGWSWRKDGVFYTINWGYKNDVRTEELVVLAEQHCAQYLDQ